eukprot:288866_1
MTTTSQNGSANEHINQFVSKVTSFEHTNQHHTDYTINIKLRINPNNKFIDVAFSYKPNEETLQSVINEMIDDLELNKDLHYNIIINSIEDAAEKAITQSENQPKISNNQSTNSPSKNIRIKNKSNNLLTVPSKKKHKNIKQHKNKHKNIKQH